MSQVNAQHCEENAYSLVTDRIFKAIKDNDFSAFKMSAEQAGLFIKSNADEEHPFWTKMRVNIEEVTECEGWDEIATYYLTDHIFVASYSLNTHPPKFITLTFHKHSNLWSLISFDYKDNINDYVNNWAFLLNKKHSNQCAHSIANSVRSE